MRWTHSDGRNEKRLQKISFQNAQAEGTVRLYLFLWERDKPIVNVGVFVYISLFYVFVYFFLTAATAKCIIKQKHTQILLFVKQLLNYWIITNVDV